MAFCVMSENGETAIMSDFVAKQFVVLFVGWLILDVLSPDEWRTLIGPFLTVKSLVMFYLVSRQTPGIMPTNNTVGFFLMTFIGYIIVHGGESTDLRRRRQGKGGNQAR